VAAVVVLLLGGWLATRFTGGDDGEVGTAARDGSPTTSPDATTPASPSAPAPSVTSSAVSAPSTTPATPATRPPTLAFTVRYPAYITIREPGGVTLVSRLFKKGEHRSYDKKVLQVVNGRPDAVRFVVNGTPRKPGPSGQTEIFTVRRKAA
jgi:hypothetical protein